MSLFLRPETLFINWTSVNICPKRQNELVRYSFIHKKKGEKTFFYLLALKCRKTTVVCVGRWTATPFGMRSIHPAQLVWLSALWWSWFSKWHQESWRLVWRLCGVKWLMTVCIILGIGINVKMRLLPWLCAWIRASCDPKPNRKPS